MRKTLDLTKNSDHITDCEIFGQAIRKASLNANRTSVTVIRGDGSVWKNREEKDTINSKSERV